jgi:hypothetical protein
VQVGYDQPTETVTLPPVGPTTVVPRNVALEPLQVQLPDVTPGNFLEVDFRVTFQNTDEAATIAGVTAVVSFNGSTTLAAASGWFGINNCQVFFDDIPAGDTMSRDALACVEIPAGATTATVQLLFATDNTGLQVFGIDEALAPGTPGCTLKATEINADVVSQPGPSVLQAL